MAHMGVKVTFFGVIQNTFIDTACLTNSMSVSVLDVQNGYARTSPGSRCGLSTAFWTKKIFFSKKFFHSKNALFVPHICFKYQSLATE